MSKTLRGIDAIEKYSGFSGNTLKRLHETMNFPMKREKRSNIWISNTDAIDEWSYWYSFGANMPMHIIKKAMLALLEKDEEFKEKLGKLLATEIETKNE